MAEFFPRWQEATPASVSWYRSAVAKPASRAGQVGAAAAQAAGHAIPTMLEDAGSDLTTPTGPFWSYRLPLSASSCMPNSCRCRRLKPGTRWLHIEPVCGSQATQPHTFTSHHHHHRVLHTSHPRGERRACILYLPVRSALPRLEAWTHGKTPRTSSSWTAFAPASLPARAPASRYGTPRLMLATIPRAVARHWTCGSQVLYMRRPINAGRAHGQHKTPLVARVRGYCPQIDPPPSPCAQTTTTALP